MIAESLRPLARPIGEFRLLPGNPRRGDVASVKRSLARFGQRKPIVVRADGTVEAGNTTLKAALELGWSEIAAVAFGDDDATAKAFALADNRTSELGSFDLAALGLMAAEVEAADPELLLAASFTAEDLDELLGRRREGKTDPDDVPPVPVEPVSRLGDVWVLGPHRLLCGDATLADDVERLMDSDRAGVVFTDPPYGIGYLPDSNLKRLGKLKNDHRDGRWQRFDEFTAFIDHTVETLLGYMSPGACYYLCMGWEHLPDVLASFKARDAKAYSVITWDRMTPRITSYPQDYIPVSEFIAYGWKRGAKRKRPSAGEEQTTIWRVKTERSADMAHTTQKPVALAVNALRNSSDKSDLVLDLFGGSGTTLIAAHATGQVARLMELDPAYCDVICRRYQEHTGVKPVLAATGEPHDFTASP